MSDEQSRSRRIKMPGDRLAQLYESERLSIAALAKRYGVSRQVVTDRLRQQGVQIRGQREAMQDANRERAFPGRTVGGGAHLLPPPGARQRQISVRFPDPEWQAIAEAARLGGHVRADGEPILGLAIRELVMEALAIRRRRR